jgi:hypothetical protein
MIDMMYPFHEDVKLTGPFLIDLLDPNNTLSQITSVNVPNAKYEEFNFKISCCGLRMNGKTFFD